MKLGFERSERKMKKCIILIVISIILLTMVACGNASPPAPAEPSRPEGQLQLLAFVDERLTEQEAMDLESSIEGILHVGDITFVSREEAFEDFLAAANIDDKALLEDLDVTFFRHRFIVSLEASATLQETQILLLQIPGIVAVIDPYGHFHEHAE